MEICKCLQLPWSAFIAAGYYLELLVLIEATVVADEYKAQLRLRTSAAEDGKGNRARSASGRTCN